MKNLKNAKKVLVMIVMMAVILITTNVFAEDAWADLSGSLNTPVNTANANTSGNALGNTANANTSSNTSNTSNTLNTTLNTATNKVNTSSYNSTNLPDTGIEDSLPAVALIVVVGISAVYAYKKVKDYQNI